MNRLPFILLAICVATSAITSAQSKSVILVDSSALIKLRGNEYHEGINIPYNATSWVSWVVHDSTGVNYLINDYEVDSLHLLILSYHLPIDKSTGKMLPRKILDIMALRFDESLMNLVDRWCDCNGTKDESIFAVVLDTNTQFFEEIVRARRVDTKFGRFVEIATKGIRCENMGYGE
jgi:hypothetical protein